MKKRKRYIIFALLTLLLGCGPYIWFKTPQPKGFDNLNAFPENLMGKYISVKDTNTISIEKNAIIREYREKLVMTKWEYKEEVGDAISEDTSFMFTDKLHVRIKSAGDSVKIFSSKDEDLFHISNRQVLRKYKGYYFLNFKDTNDYWKVKILRLVGDTLEFDFILTEEDMQKIKGMTRIEVRTDSIEDASKYYLDPSKRELRRILKRRTQGEKYVKSKL